MTFLCKPNQSWFREVLLNDGPSFLCSPIACEACERTELLKTEITLAEMDHFFLCYFGVTPGVHREYTGSTPGVHREPWWIFLMNFFVEFFVNVLTYNLLTIASFRIGVPSILFLHKNGPKIAEQIDCLTTTKLIHNWMGVLVFCLIFT